MLQSIQILLGKRSLRLALLLLLSLTPKKELQSAGSEAEARAAASKEMDPKSQPAQAKNPPGTKALDTEQEGNVSGSTPQKPGAPATWDASQNQ